MKIVNFQNIPIEKAKRYVWPCIAVFDLEIPFKDSALLWHGWSVRQNVKLGKYRLQAPLIFKPSAPDQLFSAVSIKGISPTFVPDFIRKLLKDEYGMIVDAPDKPRPKVIKWDRPRKFQPKQPFRK